MCVILGCLWGGVCMRAVCVCVCVVGMSDAVSMASPLVCGWFRAGIFVDQETRPLADTQVLFLRSQLVPSGQQCI